MTPWAKETLRKFAGDPVDPEWVRPARIYRQLRKPHFMSNYEFRRTIWRMAKKRNLSCPSWLWHLNIKLVRDAGEQELFPPRPNSKFCPRLLSRKARQTLIVCLMDREEKWRSGYVRRQQIREISSLIKRMERKICHG